MSAAETRGIGAMAMYHQVKVRPWSGFKFFVRVERPGQELRFSFFTRRKNIGFGLFYLHHAAVTADGAEDARASAEARAAVEASRGTVHVERVGQEGTLALARARSRREGTGPGEGAGSSSSTPVLALSRRNSTDSLALGPPSPGEAALGTGVGELVEILPIGKYESFEYTVHGAYRAPLRGTYVLVFDNSFSLSTSKHVFYRVLVVEGGAGDDGAGDHQLGDHQLGESCVALNPRESLCAAGWLMKRKQGVVRGWNRRWFELDSSGVLTYYLDRASPARGSIFVPDCSLIISTAQQRFSLDSGAATFHLRALRPDDLLFWLEVLNSFKRFGPPTLASSARALPPVPGPARDVAAALAQARGCLGRLRAVADAHVDVDANALAASAADALRSMEQLHALLETRAGCLPVDDDEDEREEEQFYDVQEVYVDVISEYGDACEVSEVSGEMDADEDEFAEALEDENLTEPAELSGTSTYEASIHEASAHGASVDFGPDQAQHRVPTTQLQTTQTLRTSASATLTKRRSVAQFETVADRGLVEWLRTARITLPRDDTPLYRAKLPFPAPPITVSLASVVLRKNFPAALNEPVNLLQRLAEELEYAELLDRAAALATQPLEQLVLVAAFAVSAYASSAQRAERKPYNPVLGETFEYVRPDRGYRFVAEKVGHAPVVVACHAEAPAWVWSQDLQAETRLWGKSLLVTPRGAIGLQFRDPADGRCTGHYTWRKVGGALRNVFSAAKHVENFGELLVRNERTGDVARLTFKESGLFAASGNEVSGAVCSAAGVPYAVLRGRWDDMLCREVSGSNSSSSGSGSGSDGSGSNSGNDTSHEHTNDRSLTREDVRRSPHPRAPSAAPLLQVLWRAAPLPATCAQFFSLPFFAITLNDLPDALAPCLPSTDTRFRPDQRMLESGMIEAAEREKQRVEQLQRDMRAQRDAAGQPWQPLWFTYDATTSTWAFTGQYWAAREQRFASVALPTLW